LNEIQNLYCLKQIRTLTKKNGLLIFYLLLLTLKKLKTNPMKKLLTFFTMLCTIAIVNAQAPVIQWQKTYGGTLSDDGGSIKATSDGGYIFAGRTSSNDGDVSGNNGGLDWWVVKTDAIGDIEWQKTLGGTADDIAYSVVQTTDGGYAVAGWTESNNGDVTGYQGNKDCWVVKLDAVGTLVWQKSLGGPAEEEFRHIIQTADGGYACTGWSFSNSGDASGLNGFRDTWLVKLDATGSITWQQMLGGLNDERGYTVEQTADLGYIVSSLSSSSSGDVSANYGDLDYWLVKTDALGNITWEKNYGGSGQENNRGAMQTADGGYIITGYTASSDVDVTGFNGVQDMWVVKTDNLGAITWQNSLGGSLTDRGSFITQTADGGYIASGFTASSDGDVSTNQGGFGDYWIVKLTSTGTIDWEKTMGGSGFDAGGKVAIIPNGYMMMGGTNSNNGDVTNNQGAEDMWMVKLLNSCLPGSVTGDISGDAALCTGGSTNLTINFTGTAPFLFSINGGPVQSSFTATATISVSPAVTTVYTITYIADNVCPTGTSTGSATVSVSSTGPSSSAKVSGGPVSSCENNVELITANIITGQNILYRWTGPAGTLFGTAPGGPFSAGPFSTSANQVYTQLGSLAIGSSGYSICVQGYNGCGQTGINCLWVRGKVSQPGSIVGSPTACPTTTQTYSVNVPAGAQLFTWTFSVPGAVITPTTITGNVVNVTFPSFTTGNLCVTAALACGGSSTSSSRCLTINSNPNRPGIIAGAATVCGGTNEVYSIVPVAGATSYTWSFPYTGALINGNPSPYTTANTSVTVSFPSGYNNNSELCVSANNACSTSVDRCKNIGNQIPAKPATIIASPGAWCNNSMVTFSVPTVSGASSYNWVLSNGVVNSGQGTNLIDATWGTGSGSVSVTASNACGSSASSVINGNPSCRIAGVTRDENFKVYPNPAYELIYINFKSSGTEYSVKLMNTKGQILINHLQSAKDGMNTSEIEIHDLAPGVYILEFVNGNEVKKSIVTVL